MRHRLLLTTLTLTAIASAASGQINSGNRNIMITPTNPAMAAANNLKRISTADAHKQMRAGKAVFVDVRSAEQYRLGHIKGAINIPGSQLTSRLRELPFGKMVIAYCAWPAEESSARAVLTLNAHRIKNAAALLGGYKSWVKANLPTERSR